MDWNGKGFLEDQMNRAKWLSTSFQIGKQDKNKKKEARKNIFTAIILWKVRLLMFRHIAPQWGP
jgi:hypothetical protein